jgi:hypothetical protein
LRTREPLAVHSVSEADGPGKPRQPEETTRNHLDSHFFAPLEKWLSKELPARREV